MYYFYVALGHIAACSILYCCDFVLRCEFWYGDDDFGHHSAVRGLHLDRFCAKSRALYISVSHHIYGGDRWSKECMDDGIVLSTALGLWWVVTCIRFGAGVQPSFIITSVLIWCTVTGAALVYN